jgi:hypothetical protein
MKTIKHITITMTFTVGLGNRKVSDSVYRGLQKIEEKYHGSIDDNVGNCCKDKDVSAAFDWFADNIREKDAYNWE